MSCLRTDGLKSQQPFYSILKFKIKSFQSGMPKYLKGPKGVRQGWKYHLTPFGTFGTITVIV